MIADGLYFNVMMAASSSLMVIGLILAVVKTRSDEKTAKFRMAKLSLTVAVLALGILNMAQIGVDPEGDSDYLGGCIALAVSYLQAMLFTMAVLVFIRPQEVTRRRVTGQLTAIAVVDAVLIGSFCMLPLRAFLFIYWMGIVLYVALLVYYIRWYRRSYRWFRQQIADCYEEDEIERGLRWLNILFWAALAVGVLALLMLFGRRDIDMCLTVVIAVYYAFLTASFINYELSTPIILPALEGNTLHNSEYVDNQCVTNFSATLLVTWIQQGGYLDTQKPVEEIVKELGMTNDQFHQYFQKTEGEDFRTWRIRKRIQHAQQLMQEHPDWPVTRIAQASGFNDRSWFYQQFLRFTGTTVSDFRAGR